MSRFIAVTILFFSTIHLNSGFSQENKRLVDYIGTYTYGNLDPIYLEDDNGVPDSSFAMCNYGQLEIYYKYDSMFFSMSICNATYHIGEVSGYIEMVDDIKGKYIREDEVDVCILHFEFKDSVISVQEIDCIPWHGARANFSGDYTYANRNAFSDIKHKVEAAIVVNEFFNHFNNYDAEKMGALMTNDCVLYGSDNSVVSKNIDKNGFMKVIGKGGGFEEKIFNLQVKADDKLAVAWMDFSFIFKGKIHHCGINQFNLINTDDGWKIYSIIDSRHETACDSYSVGEIDEDPAVNFIKGTIDDAMNKWHHSAAIADESNFFNFMAEDCIYLGTDASERWTKEEFKEFATPHFEKGKAWDFKTNWRNIYFHKDMELAWFEESLDTWMGECRGSGVIEFTNIGWKLKHYNLSVTIDNDKIKSFIELVGEE